MGYAYRLLRKDKYAEDTKLRTVLVNLLKYGEAMQSYFKHDVNNLVTAGLTADELALVPADRTLNDSLTKTNNNYYGTSFVMKSNISMSMYVLSESIGDGGKAVVTFYNKSGENAEPVGEPITISTSTTVGRYCVFNLNNVTPAKSGQYMKIQFFTADGKEVVTANNESMESYMARWKDTTDDGSKYAGAVMKFMDAAKVYFGN